MSRIILKVSGEALKDNNSYISKDKLNIVLDIINLLKDKHKIAIVVGGGNLFRGRSNTFMNKVNADTIGMLATIMNALYIKDYLDNFNIKNIISTPFNFNELIPNYSDEEILNNYNDGNVVIFGGGVGMSGYSSDSATILASDIVSSDLIIKLTNVDGVYNKDPRIDNNAIKYDKLSYEEVINNDLKVMDKYAVIKCMENNIKILVMNFMDYKDINKFFEGNNIGTLIGG